MISLTHALSTTQERILASNFSKAGPFYQHMDMHCMLDCACPPELRAAATIDLSKISTEEPLGIPFKAKLREEFFGGILYDCDHHRHYMLDQIAYGLVEQIVTTSVTAQDLREVAGFGGAQKTLESLLEAGLVGNVAVPKCNVEIFPARDISLPYLQSPIIVEVEVTYGCFRACKHCAYEASPDAATPDELTANQWRDIFFKLANAGVLIIQLTGGDPLFRKDSFDIVQAASDAGMSVYVRSDTAALSSTNVERLKNLPGLWHIGTSMDGVDEEAHDWMRGAGSFVTLTKRVRALADAGIPVSVGATLHKNNYATVREMGQVATSIGAQWFDIGFLSPVGRGVQLKDLVLDERESIDSLNMYLDGIRANEYSPSHAHYLQRAASSSPFGDLAGFMDHLPFLTEWPFSRLRIDPTGSSYTAGKLKGSDFAGGFNLAHQEVDFVWDNSPNLRSLREIGNGGRIHGLDYRELCASYDPANLQIP